MPIGLADSAIVTVRDSSRGGAGAGRAGDGGWGASDGGANAPGTFGLSVFERLSVSPFGDA